MTRWRRRHHKPCYNLKNLQCKFKKHGKIFTLWQRQSLHQNLLNFRTEKASCANSTSGSGQRLRTGCINKFSYSRATTFFRYGLEKAIYEFRPLLSDIVHAFVSYLAYFHSLPFLDMRFFFKKSLLHGQ